MQPLVHGTDVRGESCRARRLGEGVEQQYNDTERDDAAENQSVPPLLQVRLLNQVVNHRKPI